MTDWQVLPDNRIGLDGSVYDKMYKTAQDGFQVGRARIKIKSCGGSVKYQTCVIFFRSNVTTQETTNDPIRLRNAPVTPKD